MLDTQWKGKKVAFLGDSITDKIHVGTEKNYWQYLEEYLGIEVHVYGINGQRWIHGKAQAEKLREELGDSVDAIMIFLGTNDFNSSVPLGEWWTCVPEEANFNGQLFTRPRRYFNYVDVTLRGSINSTMAYIKLSFPQAQTMLCTPIHRGYAEFGPTNVQPEESFPNAQGLYLESYIQVIREAADIWCVPLIDLYRESSLLPCFDAYTDNFHDAATDRLHPSAKGHERMAKSMMYRMLSLPANFK